MDKDKDNDNDNDNEKGKLNIFNITELQERKNPKKQTI
jgi:hypothetical protein